MKFASYLLVLLTCSILVTCAILPEEDNSIFKSSNLERRQESLLCSEWKWYENMTSTPDTLIESTGVSSWRHLSFKQWRSFYTQIEPYSSIKAVELIAKVTGDAFLTLETKAQNNKGLKEHSLLLAELILFNNPKFQYVGRKIWWIAADANHQCYIKTGFKDTDVQDLRVWQPKAGFNFSVPPQEMFL